MSDDARSEREPIVLFDQDVCELLGIGLTTLKKLRRAGAFPIPELRTLDKRHRYARADVEAYVSRETTSLATPRAAAARKSRRPKTAA